MSLRIEHFNTTCYVPQQRRNDADTVDRLVRSKFARDLGEHLGPSLARQPAIIRIRILPMRVVIPASELNEDALSLRWTQEFGKTLFTALAYPSGTGPFEVFRSNSIPDFLASAIHDLLDGTASAKWEYAEFEPFFRLGSTQAALALICEWPQQSLPVLLCLSEQSILGRLLARLDEIAIDRLFRILGPSSEPDGKTLFIADLIAVATLALESPPEKPPALRSQAYALTLFVEARKTSQPASSPRALFHALLALAVLLNEQLFWPGISQERPRTGHLPSNVIAVLESIARTLADQSNHEPSGDSLQDHPQAARHFSSSDAILENIGGYLRQYMQSTLPANTPSPPTNPIGKTSAGSSISRKKVSSQLVELDRLLQVLRVELTIPAPPAQPLEARWIAGEWCGLFFLASTLERLGWIPAWRRLPDFQAGGVACLLAGIAMAVAEKFDPAVASLEPAVALFCGYLDHPDLMHARRVFQESPREARLRVLQAAFPDESVEVTVEAAAETWESTFDYLAVSLLRLFASRIRGFRQATRQGIVRSFVARPGRIRIEPQRLVIFPAASPFNVAIHLSGMDEPVDSSLWPERRRIEFELGDL